MQRDYCTGCVISLASGAAEEHCGKAAIYGDFTSLAVVSTVPTSTVGRRGEEKTAPAGRDPISSGILPGVRRRRPGLAQ
jgi:hypothetical protein